MLTNRRSLFLFLLMLILVPLAGEPKFHPFGGDFANFRVSFGSPIFLLFLLWMRNVPLILSGFSTGIVVVVFRAFLDVYSMGIPFPLAVWQHTATFFYYFVYASCFLLPNFDKTRIYNKALQIAAWSIIAEIAASIAELSGIQILLKESITLPGPEMLLKISIIAILRCFFILSFFFLTQLYAAETRLFQEQRERSRMMLLISNLYEEVIQLSKSQKNAETITRNCYKIYERLHVGADTPEQKSLAKEILALAGQLHDIKKDNQRIYAGLCALTNNRRIVDYESPKELARLILDTQQKYALSLKKSIVFSAEISPNLPPLHVYTLLSLVNNLIANAVEAIEQTGSIKLSFKEKAANLYIDVQNTGSAIPAHKLDLVFKPGYTTKFDSDGNASTGIGLSYVKDLTESLGGSVTMVSDAENEVSCTLMLPLEKCSAARIQNYRPAHSPETSRKD